MIPSVKYTTITPIEELTLAFQQTEVYRHNLLDFVEHLRKNQSVIEKYQGVCDSLKDFLDNFDISQPYEFASILVGIDLLPSLNQKLGQLRTMMLQCEDFPDLFGKKELMDSCNAFCSKCQNEMIIADIEATCSEADENLKKIEQLRESFRNKELERQSVLRDKLAEIYNSLEAKENFIWQNTYQELENDITKYGSSTQLDKSIITSLEQKVNDAVNDRRNYMISTETKYVKLTTSKYISDDYNNLKSLAITRNEYDRQVQELIDKRKAIILEKIKSFFLKSLKVIGVVFVFVGSAIAAIINLFLSHDDK